MAGIKHAFTSAKSDDADTTLVRPTDWNADHTITGSVDFGGFGANNIGSIDATTEATIEAAIDTLANLTSVQGRTVTLADAGADAIWGWDDSANAYENLTGAEAFAVIEASADAVYQPLDADLTSWAGVTRASGFDTFAATPSSANLASLVTNETGSGALVFGTSPGFTTAANPVSNDGAALGTTALQWSNLFVAEGAKIDWDNGDLTLVQTGNAVCLSDDSQVALATFDTVTTPRLQVLGAGSSPSAIAVGRWSADTAAPHVILAKNRNATVGSYTIISSADSCGEILFQGSTASAYVNYGRIDCLVTDNTAASEDGAVRLLCVQNSALAVKLRADPAGVKFGTDTADANAIDTYEEGTWTPAAAFGGSSTGVTYTARAGSYVKIGQLVLAAFSINLSSNGTGTGSATVTGLPFNSNADLTMSWTGELNLLDGSGVSGGLLLRLADSASVLNLFQSVTGNDAAITETNIGDTATFRGSIVYRAST